MDLAQKHCVPCEGGVPPLGESEVRRLAAAISDWSVGQKKISREFKFKNFREAMSFVNKVAEVAEAERHHPDMKISYNRVQLELTTHAIGGLSENDFILAAKINEIVK